MTSTYATALVLEAPRRLVRRQLELPVVGPGDALLRVEACGLCGTDHELYTGDLPWAPGFIPGHETVGTIEEIGELAAQRWGVGTGDRVAVASRPACRQCGPCERGDLHACLRYTGADSYGLVAVDRPPGLWGGYATHHYLGPDSVVHRVPVHIPALDATLFNPVGAGVSWAVELPATAAGEVVVVLGPGIRGIAAVAAAKAAGASHVMVTGHGPRDAGRLEVARRMGADLVVDVADVDPLPALLEGAGRLADVVVDVTAKAPSAFAQAIALAGRGGRIVVAGVRGGPVTVTFEPDLISVRGLQLIGATGVSTNAHRRAIELLADGEFPVGAVTRRTAGFGEIGQLLAEMAGEGPAEPALHAVFVPDPL